MVSQADVPIGHSIGIWLRLTRQQGLIIMIIRLTSDKITHSFRPSKLPANMGTKYHQIDTGDDSELIDRNINTSDDIQLGESVPPAYSNESNVVVQINNAPTPLTDAELRNHLPRIDGSNADVCAFIQLLLQKRGESYHQISDGVSLVAPASGRDIRYLTGADLHTLEAEELAGMFPETWPPALQKLVAKDVKRFTDWVSSFGTRQ